MIIERIVAFIRKLFARGQSRSRTLAKVRIEELPHLLEMETINRQNTLENTIAKKLSEIKHVHAKSLELLKRISEKDIEEGTNDRMNRAATTGKRQIESQLKRLLERIDPKGRGQTLSDARAYFGESQTIFVSEILSFRKNIVYTSIMMKDEMKELGECLQELQDSYASMITLFSTNADLFELEHIKENVGHIIKNQEQIRGLDKEKVTIEEKITQLMHDTHAQEEKIQTVTMGSEAVALKKLEEEKAALVTKKQQLKIEISSMLATVDRPLQRYKSMIDSGRSKVSREEGEMVTLILTNPMAALKKEPSGKLFKEIISHVKAAIEDGTLELKDHEKEKKIEALEDLLEYNFFEGVFWKLNELTVRQGTLEKELTANSLKHTLEKEERTLTELRNEEASLTTQRDTLTQQQEKIRGLTKKELEETLRYAEKLLGKSIVIIED